jgi:cytidylate kinase
LRQAEDAVVLDNSNMTMDEQFQFALDLVHKRLKLQIQ